MAIRARVDDPVWANRSTNPVEVRRAQEGLFTRVTSGQRGGRIGGPNPVGPGTGTTGSAPKSNVVACHVAVPRGGGGMYIVALPATVTVDHGASSSTGARTDLVILRVYDTEYGETIPAEAGALGVGQTGVAFVETVAGTPGAGPPAPPAGAVEVLQHVVFGAGTNVLPSYPATGAGVRTAVTRGGIVPVADEAEQNTLTPYEALTVLRLLTGNVEMFWQGAWRRIASLNGRNAVSWTPQLRGGGVAVTLGTGHAASARAHIIGKEMDLALSFKFGTTGINGQSGALTINLPTGVTTAAGQYQQIPCTIYCPTQDFANGGVRWLGFVEFEPSSTSGTILMPQSFNDCSLRVARNAHPSTPTAAGTGIPRIDAAAGGPDYVLQNSGTLVASGRLEIA